MEQKNLEEKPDIEKDNSASPEENKTQQSSNQPLKIKNVTGQNGRKIFIMFFPKPDKGESENTQ